MILKTMSPSLTSGVSVLICTYNGSIRLVPTLEHLARQILPNGVQWEIILVDNNSNDDTAAVSLATWERCGKPAPLRVLNQPKPGKQFALELAYDSASYEFMCIVDDDNWLHDGYLDRGYQIMKQTPLIGLLGGCSVGAFEVEPPEWFSDCKAVYAVGKPVVYLPEGKREFTNGEVLTGVLWGAGLFVRYSIWQELKTLQFKSLFTGRQGEKQLTAGEDDELCYLARMLGYKLWYNDELVLTHYMTAGRLKMDYLKRLYAAAPRSFGSLSAYQKVLSPNPEKYYRLINWVKDWIYSFIFLIKVVFSMELLKSFFRNDFKIRLVLAQRFWTWFYFTIGFARAREDFWKILHFKRRIEQRSTFS